MRRDPEDHVWMAAVGYCLILLVLVVLSLARAWVGGAAWGG
jgi:hypothetical protein